MADQPPRANAGDEIARQYGFNTLDEMVANVDSELGGSSLAEGLAARRAKLEELTGKTQRTEQFVQGPGRENIKAMEGMERVPGEAPSARLGDLRQTQGVSEKLLSDAAGDEISGLNALTNFINGITDSYHKQKALDIAKAEQEQEWKEKGLKYDEETKKLEPISEGEGGITEPIKDKDTMKQEADLRKEFSDEINDLSFKEQKTNYENIISANATPEGDLSMIFAYMKLLDPASTVREGEQATAEKTRGVPDNVRNLYNKLIKGGKLTVSQRNNYKKQATDIYNNLIAGVNELSDFYAGQAQSAGLDPDSVVGFIGEIDEGEFTPEEEEKTGLFGGFFKNLFGGSKNKYIIESVED